MAEGLLGGILGDEQEKPDIELRSGCAEGFEQTFIYQCDTRHSAATGRR